MRQTDYRHLTRQRYQDPAYAKYYYEEYTAPLTVSNLRSKIIALRERTLIRHLLGRCNPTSQRVLDIPCGTGKIASVLADPPVFVAAADVSVAMMTLAKRYYGAVRGFAGFVRADAALTPFPDTAFDCVICLRLLHRVPDGLRRVMLTECSRVSRRYVIASIGIVDRVQRWRLRIRSALLPGDVSIPSPIGMAAFRDIARAAGLELIRTCAVLPILSSEQIVLMRKVGA